jgi:hypothetical protein
LRARGVDVFLLDHPAVVGEATLDRDNAQTHAWLYPWHRSDAELSFLVRGPARSCPLVVALSVRHRRSTELGPCA